MSYNFELQMYGLTTMMVFHSIFPTMIMKLGKRKETGRVLKVITYIEKKGMRLVGRDVSE